MAPFFSFYSLTNQNQIQPSGSIDPNDITTIDAKMDILNIGASLGYQFNIKNRFSIDMVLFGPSISSYKLNMDFNSGFLPPYDEWSEGALALRDYLFAQHPWLETLVDDGNIDVRGKKAFWGMGFRYVIQVGYRF